MRRLRQPQRMLKPLGHPQGEHMVRRSRTLADTHMSWFGTLCSSTIVAVLGLAGRSWYKSPE